MWTNHLTKLLNNVNINLTNKNMHNIHRQNFINKKSLSCKPSVHLTMVLVRQERDFLIVK